MNFKSGIVFSHNWWAWMLKSRQCQINFVWKKHVTHSPLVVGILINDPFQGIVRMGTLKTQACRQISADNLLSEGEPFCCQKKMTKFSPTSLMGWICFIPIFGLGLILIHSPTHMFVTNRSKVKKYLEVYKQLSY